MLKYIVFLSLIFLSSESFACSCIRSGDINKVFKYAPSIFWGSVISIETTAEYGPLKVALGVERSFKGNQAPLAVVYTTRNPGLSCGYPFKLHQQYLVIAYEADRSNSDGRAGELAVNVCGYTEEIEQEHKDKLLRLKNLPMEKQLLELYKIVTGGVGGNNKVDELY